MKKTICLMIALLLLCGCDTVIPENTSKDSENIATSYSFEFTEKETDADYQTNGSTYITLGNEDVKITRGGTYILEGTMNDAGIIVEVPEDEDVQLVLNGVKIKSGDFAGIYIIQGDEVKITLAEGTENTISDSSSHTQIDDNDVDALIYSKADLVVNGSGALILESSYSHGIVSKDDLVITGGSYRINVAGQGLSGKDCLKISGGDFDIVSGKDAMKSDNSEDEYRGYVYITGGDFDISTGADAIYAYRLVKIEGGSFMIETTKSSSVDSYKAVKSDGTITISGGNIQIDSADDGIHSDDEITITGGSFIIDSGRSEEHTSELQSRI